MFIDSSIDQVFKEDVINWINSVKNDYVSPDIEETIYWLTNDCVNFFYLSYVDEEYSFTRRQESREWVDKLLLEIFIKEVEEYYDRP